MALIIYILCRLPELDCLLGALTTGEVAVGS